jgi:hypothetical protein
MTGLRADAIALDCRTAKAESAASAIALSGSLGCKTVRAVLPEFHEIELSIGWALKTGHSARLVLMFVFASFLEAPVRATTSGTWLKMRMAETG